MLLLERYGRRDGGSTTVTKRMEMLDRLVEFPERRHRMSLGIFHHLWGATRGAIHHLKSTARAVDTLLFATRHYLALLKTENEPEKGSCISQLPLFAPGLQPRSSGFLLIIYSWRYSCATVFTTWLSFCSSKPGSKSFLPDALYTLKKKKMLNLPTLQLTS